MSKLKTKFVDFIKLIFPSSGAEFFVFLFFLISYGILGSYIALDYRIIFDDRIPWDAYFSFDNRSIVLSGGSFERHPLSYYFFNWMRITALWISDGKTDAVFRLTLAWFSNMAVSLSVLQVFKYLKNIIGLPLVMNVLLTLFFGVFSTVLVLSFTPENFTYTLFLLTAYNHYSAQQLKNGRKISAVAMVTSGIAVGGITITNIVKVFIPVLFEKGLFKSWKKFGNAVVRIAITCICFVVLYLNRINFNYNNIFNKTSEQYEKFSNVHSTPLWDMIMSYFFGENILLSNFIIRDKHNMKGFEFKGLIMDEYTSIINPLNSNPFISCFLILSFAISTI